MDLEIRGAGNLLGAEQSGNLMAVGYETYMEMLQETIEELRGKIHKAEIDPEIRLPVEARLPEDYVADVSQRLVLYKRLSSARDDDEVARIRDEMLDRYGVLPAEAENLCRVIGLKILARKLGIVTVGLNRDELAFGVAESAQIDPKRLVHLLTHAGSEMRVTPDHKIYFPAPLLAAGPDALFDSARSALIKLGA
jgi:transcription-repair coupling factor (superfamily II helicase)